MSIATTSGKTDLPSSRPPRTSRTISKSGGLSGAGLQHETSRVLGGFAAIESVAHGFQSGLRFLSLMTLFVGLAVAVALADAAKDLCAPPGSGYL